MKNITLAVDEAVLRRVRQVASERHSTVNALVREYLESLARGDDDRERERQQSLSRLQAMSESGDLKAGAGYSFTREDAYAERLR